MPDMAILLHNRWRLYLGKRLQGMSARPSSLLLGYVRMSRYMRWWSRCIAV